MKTGIKINSAAALIFLILTAAGCNESGEKSRFSNSPSDNPTAGFNEIHSPGVSSFELKKTNSGNYFPESEIRRMLIRTGNVKIESDNYDGAEKIISGLVKTSNGYITNSSAEMNASGKKQGTITARIPSDKFDSFLNSLNSAGKILSQEISGNDVTSEYIDLDARQKTQRELEKRLLELLNNKTAGLSDVVSVEEKLSGVREKIESTEGRMKYLKNQSDYSTLEVSVYEPSMIQTSSGEGFFYEIQNGLKKGLKGFTEVVSIMITIFISALPVMIILFLIILIFRKVLRHGKLNPGSA
ncbi:MAG: DUF4349 domain-containing protein [Bacteroidetes bacterium]|nr:DUF4349 domain-containing protein [Bacteroidota bacterium]